MSKNMDVASLLKKEALEYQHVSYDSYFQRRIRHPLQKELAIERKRTEDCREEIRQLNLKNDKLEKIIKTLKACDARSDATKVESSGSLSKLQCRIEAKPKHERMSEQSHGSSSKKEACPMNSASTYTSKKHRVTLDTSDCVQLRNLGDMIGLAFAVENGEKTEFDFCERLRRFHDKLRKASVDELPPRVGNNWQWKPEDLKKALSFVEKNLEEAVRNVVSFFGCAGPEGVHICYHSSLRPPLLYKGDQQLHMILFSHDLVRKHLAATSDLQGMADAIQAAPVGRWYFIGGRLPADWQILRSCLHQEQFPLPEGDFNYIVVIGCKGNMSVRVIQLGPREVLVAFHNMNIRRCERSERRVCGNCRNPIYAIS